jgi:nanoRNase/pAp phosphatase (c-di-AMP/oligoRNAs hydrolase)
MKYFNELLPFIHAGDRVWVQAHNFPDHDAVAAAFGVFDLLRQHDIKSSIIYDGEIQRSSLQRMIDLLGVPIAPFQSCGITASDKVIVVDGCVGNKNVTSVGGTPIAVIDHHRYDSSETVPFLDVRSNLGSCATLVATYYNASGREIPRMVATALMVGIGVDTAHLLRGASVDDVNCFAELSKRADLKTVHSILRNNTQQRDLAFYKYSLEHAVIDDRFAYCYFPQGCDQNLLGILGDFFLGIDNVDFALVCARNGHRLDMSIRAEENRFHCTDIIHQVLDGLGSCGGHQEMAGGFMLLSQYTDPAMPPEEFVRQRFFELYKSLRERRKIRD